MKKDYIRWLVANGKVRDELRNIAADFSKHRRMLDVASREANNIMIGGTVALIQADVNKFLELLGDEEALGQIGALTLENQKETKQADTLSK